jgi:hypothetical protein
MALFIISCTSPKKGNETSIAKREIDPWIILDNAIQEQWQKVKLEQVMGKPHESFRFKDNGHDSYLYFENYEYKGDVVRHQAWTFNFDKDDFITGVSHSPRRMFMDELRKRWADLKCFEKSERVKTVPHVIRYQKYLSCEGGKIKAYYSNYEEVQDIVVVK